MPHNKKTLSQWLTMIESFHPDEIELGLERIIQIADKLDLISQTAKVIIVGGTNGKGSCVATLESLALESKLKVGCYTSPHLLKFNERIRVNGQDVFDQTLQEAFEIVDHARENLALTFFEFTTLVALLIFKQASLDLVVLEVGLGGRLDAVNIIEPDATIITTIDLDHQSWLGNNLENIAFEKSGICRTEISNFVGDSKSYQLIMAARPEDQFNLTLIDEKALSDKIYLELCKSVANQSINPYRLLLQNLMLATQAFQTLFSDVFSILNLSEVISRIQIKGRFQKISANPLVILDVGHNVQAATNLVSQISQLKLNPAGRRVAICGLMADKAITDYLKVLDEVIDQWHFVDLPVERAATAEQLKNYYIQSAGNNQFDCFANVRTALEQTNCLVSENDQVFVLGSFITVAEALDVFSD